MCDVGTRSGKLWTPRRGATTRAASLHVARPERDARATRCGLAHGEITTSHATTYREAAGYGRKEYVGRDRPAGQRGAAGCESGQQFANWAGNAGIFGHRGAAQQRNNAGRIRANRKAGAKRASNAMRRGAPRDQNVARDKPAHPKRASSNCVAFGLLTKRR